MSSPREPRPKKCWKTRCPSCRHVAHVLAGRKPSGLKCAICLGEYIALIPLYVEPCTRHIADAGKGRRR